MASTKIPEQKVILCGEYGVGKSSLFRRYANDTFVTATDRQSTLGLDHFDKTYKVRERELKVNIIQLNINYTLLLKCNGVLAPIVGYWWYGKGCLSYIQLL